jgi:NADPH:quinone reductase
MRAWRVHELGEPVDVLRLDEVDAPLPGPGQVRIRVGAAALNYPDILLCQGRYQARPPLPFTPGLEVAGQVTAVGEGAEIPLGARVAAMPELPAGGLAEVVVAAATEVLPVPDSMPDVAAAAFQLTYQTAWFALHRRAAIRPGETLLVHAGAGGVGSAAIQLGVAAGARVLATAGSPEKVRVCHDLGAEQAVNYRTDDFVEVVREATGGRGADVVVDPVGGDVLDRSRRCVAFEGRLVVVGFTGGRIAEVPTNHLLLKNYAVLGLHWGRYREVAPRLVREAHDELTRLYAGGRIDPLLFAELPLAEAPSGLRAIAERRTWGKLVVVP